MCSLIDNIDNEFNAHQSEKKVSLDENNIFLQLVNIVVDILLKIQRVLTGRLLKLI